MKANTTNTIAKRVLFTISGMFIVSWLVLAVRGFTDQHLIDLWAGSYGLILILALLYGILNARQWGGFKSWLGKAMLFLAFALILEEFGQLAFSYYNVFRHVEVPYPSVADVGFFGFIPFCLLSMISLANTVGVSRALKKPLGMVVALVTPLLIVTLSYMIFLNGYDSTSKSALTIFLDFGYPLGHSLSISVLLVALLFSASKLGGLMKRKITLFLAGITLQYIAEFNFLYQNTHLSWVSGHYGDLLYLIAYSVEAFALVNLVSPYQSGSPAPNTDIVPTRVLEQTPGGSIDEQR